MKRTLVDCYTLFKDSYKSQSCPLFGKPDHDAIFLMSVYKQRLIKEAPVHREVTRWMDQSLASLQDTLDDAEWDIFRHSSNDVNIFMEEVVGFIRKMTEHTVKKNVIRTFPKQKT